MGISNIIILTGHRKGGTSVFHRLFDGHPDIYLYPADITVLYAYFPAFATEFADNPAALRERLAKVLRKHMSPLEEHTAKAGFGAEDFIQSVLEKLADDQLTSKKHVIRAIADTWVALYYQTGENRPFVFKETSQSLFFDEFARIFPGMKMISLVRDPRDNYAAILAGVKNYYAKMGEGEKASLASVINRARLDLMSARLNQSNDPERFMALRFEDLVANTEAEMKKVADFIEIPYRKSMTEPTSLGENYEGNSHDGAVFKGLVDKNVGRWPERISDEEAMIIEAWMGVEMSDWGYTPFFSPGKAQAALAEFYNWYNTRYFYHDSI